jgi:hypothetical protein
MNSSGMLFPGVIDRREVYAAEIRPPTASPTAARSLGCTARLAGRCRGRRAPGGRGDARRGDTAPSASSVDATLGVPTRFALGFMKAMDNRSLPGNDSVLTGRGRVSATPGMVVRRLR